MAYRAPNTRAVSVRAALTSATLLFGWFCFAGTPTLASAPATGQVGQRAVNQQRVFVSVVDKQGAPVTDLTPADFSIKEDGRTREVLKVEPATAPMQIALLVDTSEAMARAVPDLRAALKAFADRIWAQSPDTQIALYTFGDRPTMQADFSSSAQLLARQIDRLFSTPGSGAYFIDAVVDVAGVLEKRGGDRSIILAYVDENGPEFSNRRNDQAFKAVSEAHASLWSVTRQGFSNNTATPENRERAIVIGDVGTRSGGRTSNVFDSNAIHTRMDDVASQLLGALAITYGRPESLIPPERLEVKVTAPDLRVAAPRWTTR